MKKNIHILLFFSMSFICLSSLHAQKLNTLKTKELNLIYYSKAHSYIVRHLASCFENTLDFYKKLFDYSPTEEGTLFLQDFSDYGNGGATAVPVNLIMVSIAPFLYTYEVMTGNERMNWLMNHELVHVITMDKASNTDKFYRSLFLGKVFPEEKHPVSMFYSYLTTPRTYCPRWYHEGIAVFMETWMSGGLGRALGYYDEMVFRTKVHDNSYLYHAVGLEAEGTAIDFQVGAISYLYGTRFFSYLANRYGPEKLIEWTSRTKGSKRYFASQFKKVFNTSMSDEWSKWILFEKEWQKANLASIRKYPTTPFRPITREALGSVSRVYHDPHTGRIYAAIRYPGQVAHVAAIDIHTGRIEKICDIKGAALYYVCSLTYDPSTGTIFYTTDNNYWRDLNVLDVKTGKSKKLMKDLRAGDLAFDKSDKSIWGVRHKDGISTLIKIDPPYTDWTAIYAFPYGKDIYDIDISPDGSILTGAVTNESGWHKLIKMRIEKLLQGDGSYDVLFDFEDSSPANFVFSPDGKYLYGSSYYSGVSNIYRYDFEKSDMETLSNCETGFFRPVPVSEDSLIVMRYTGEGFVPVLIPNEPVTHKVSAIKLLGQEVVENHPVVESWMPGSPRSVNIDSLTIYSGKYNSWKNIKLSSAYPIIEGYKEYVSLGYCFNFQNQLQFNRFDITASYTPAGNLPSDERIHLGLNYHYWNWKVSANYNGASFYDLFGPTKVSRKGYSLGLEYNKTLIYDKPRQLDFHFKLAGYGGLEKLPDYQNIYVTFDKFMIANVGLKYDYVKKSLGAVDEEKGVKFHLVSSAYGVRSKLYPHFYAKFDYGFSLPLNHSSIWLRNSFGYSIGDTEDEFANFYFGGFGNNWVDYLTEKRYREYYSFPGVKLNSIGGTNYGKMMLEWNLPPIRFRRFGYTSFYFNWSRLSLFSTGIMTNLESETTRRTLLNFGAQIDFRIVMFSLLESTISLGYAVAVEEDQRTANEFMFSLKIL